MAMNDTPKEYLEAMLIGLIPVKTDFGDSFDVALKDHFDLLEEIAKGKYNGDTTKAVREEQSLADTWQAVQRERLWVMQSMLIDKFGNEGNKVMNAFLSGAYNEEFSKLYGDTGDIVEGDKKQKVLDRVKRLNDIINSVPPEECLEDDDIFDRTFGAWADRPDHLEELHEASQARLQDLFGDDTVTTDPKDIALATVYNMYLASVQHLGVTVMSYEEWFAKMAQNAENANSVPTLNAYQREASTTAHYPHEQGVVYTALGLAGEAGEIANKMKKVIRGDKSITECREDLASELGDVLWYVAMLAKELGYSLDDIAQLNLAKLKDRQARNTIKGDGDNR